MAKSIHFNTGRLYSVHGQRITATLHDDGIVTFFDHDRMVHGEFNAVYPTDVTFNARSVMTVYDAGAHRNSTRAWTDGMQRGGCNSKFEG